MWLQEPLPSVRRMTALAILVVLVAVGCGGSGDDDGEAGESGGAGDGGTVSVEHRYGTTEVPVRPERIVALDTQWTDVLLALDTPPVGYLAESTVDGELPWRGDRLDGITSIEATDSLPYEEIAELQPDLILVTYLATEQADYETLSDIAPTIPTLTANQVDSWQDMARTAGTFLDAPDEAEALIDEVDGAVREVADELPGLDGKTFALVNFVPGDAFYVVADPEDGANVVFSQLGLELPQRLLDAADGVSGRVELSLEQAELLDSDVLVLFTNGAEPTDIAGYNQLPAVTGGAVAVLELADVIGLNTPTPLSVPYALDLIRPALEAAAA
jgi:ABC-type Fe3+-hydroxamate transport system substrate-binding protein